MKNMNKPIKKPPVLARWIFRLFTFSAEKTTIAGDMDEFFYLFSQEKGRFRAKLWYRLQVIKSIFQFFGNFIYRSSAMFKNYLKVSFRNIKRQKGYSFINIFGLAVGLACCILILLWVKNELSYDKSFENSGNIYRIIGERKYSTGQVLKYVPVPPPLAPSLLKDFPEITKIARIRLVYGRNLIIYEDKSFYENKIALFEKDFFNIFTVPFIKGDPEKALENPMSVVITEKTAERYFGDKDPLNKTLSLNNQADFTVTGVIGDFPENSHIDFDVFFSLEFLEANQYDFTNWGDNVFYTYVLLENNADVKILNSKLINYMDGKAPVPDIRLELQPLNRIHLYSDAEYDFAENSDIKYVYLFSALALSILVIACINFMNLTTARSVKRAKEVGMRKVAGAKKSDLVFQFFGESFILTSAALVIALIIVRLLLPLFNEISGKALLFSNILDLSVITGILCITFLTGLFSGTYPALYLSSFQPSVVFKGLFKSGSKALSLRKVLVVIQFTASVVLILGTIVIFCQLSFIQKQKLGFDREQLVYLSVNQSLLGQYESFKNEMLKNPGILNMTLSSDIPTRTVHLWGGLDWPGKAPDDERQMNFYTVDHDFIKTMGLQIIEGRDFSEKYSTDFNNYIINDSAAELMGLENPVGQWFSWSDNRGTIIGLMKDFNFKSVHSRIEPLVLRIAQYYNYVILRINPENTTGTLSYIGSCWKKFAPLYPFELNFLDESINRLYENDRRTGTLFKYFTALAIFISCLGLFGLAAFMAEQRTKEIGIRKVLGSSISGVVIILSKDFLKWVLISNLIAWPIAFYAMNKWLQNFAYRMNINIWMFLLSGAAALIVALVTVSFQTIKAAAANPVDSLRNE